MGARVGALRDSAASGRLTAPPVRNLRRDPRLPSQLGRALLGVTADHRVAVPARYVGRGRSAQGQVLELSGREIGGPQPAFPRVADDRVAWHTREVFRSPVRTAA
ncbi:hypothetical protein GCM10023191_012540 [Actinoallomurus oryzae]|uniref:Uncharacterized protein n=1 Tax=Actinoallomurus oryzae TaxID=502180 RepID=A0ABP8PH30_9ACTN